MATGVMLDPIEVEDRRGDRFLGTRYGAGGKLYRSSRLQSDER